MAMHNYVAAVCIVVLAAIGTLAFSQDSPPATDPLTLIRSDKERDREQGRRQILEERARVISALLDIIKSPRAKTGDSWQDERTPRNIAIACIGEYRAPEAVSALVPLLEPDRPPTNWDRPELSPAAKALARIGKPSVSAIINFLATTRDATKVSAWHARAVLCKIEGREAAQRMLKDTAAAEKDTARRAALQTNLEALPGPDLIEEMTGQ